MMLSQDTEARRFAQAGHSPAVASVLVRRRPDVQRAQRLSDKQLLDIAIGESKDGTIGDDYDYDGALVALLELQNRRTMRRTVARRHPPRSRARSRARRARRAVRAASVTSGADGPPSPRPPTDVAVSWYGPALFALGCAAMVEAAERRPGWATHALATAGWNWSAS